MLKFADQLNGYPAGDASAWKEHYAPFVRDVIVHRKTPRPALVSAVVVAWRSAEFVVECLDHLRDQNGIDKERIEIIFVDNGGLDSVREAIAQRVHVEIQMLDNVGLCPARNLGAAHATAPILAFIDDDGLVAQEYFANALRYFENDENIVAIRGRITHKEHPYFTTLATHYDRGEKPLEDCLVTEGNSLLRRDAYIMAQGFAENLSGHEGIDLTFRLKQQDERAQVLYAPDVVMRHDYINSWQKFYHKNFRYAGVDTRVAWRDPELSTFMDTYFAQRFPKRELSLDEKVAVFGLSYARSVLRIGARVAKTVQHLKN